ncbi:MAG: KTSC domain-containing protein, partial [Caulobacteraceae bacterium]|nr:KTSC domain-containing protein [Caulobacteraceae bacterium]
SAAAITDIDYDDDRAKLMVRLNDGCAYVFVGVPGEVCRAFRDAPSPLGFLAAELCDRYPYNRLPARGATYGLSGRAGRAWPAPEAAGR